MSLADILKQCRIASGLSQADLGRRTGLAKQAISNMETGRRPASVKAAAKICQACGFTLKVTYAITHEAPDGAPTKR